MNSSTKFYTNLFYRSQRSCGKVIFSQASVILSTRGGVGVSKHALGRHPPGQTGEVCIPACTVSDTPMGRHIPRQIHLRRTPPGKTGGVYPSMHWFRHPPGRPLQRTVRILLECYLVFSVSVSSSVSASMNTP